MQFQKVSSGDYFEFITHDSDDVDSTLTVDMRSETLGNFTVNGKFKTNPNTLSSDETAMEISYSNVNPTVPTQFAFFKADIN